MEMSWGPIMWILLTALFLVSAIVTKAVAT